MNRILSISLLIAGTAITGCHSNKKDNSYIPITRNTTDTTSSQVATPSSDTLIKDTVMKDSVGKQKNSATPDKVSSR